MPVEFRLPVPNGVAVDTFRNVLSATYAAHCYLHRNPSVAEIAEHSSHTKHTIAKIIQTVEFKEAIAERGITWGGSSGLSPEQQYTLSILLNPTDRRSLQAKLKSAGITYTKYRGWLKQPVFSRYLMQQAEEVLTDHHGDMMVALANKGISGDLNAIKFAYELTGRHNPAANQVIDLQRVVGLLLEVITKHVTDASILNRIVADISNVMPSNPNSTQTAANQVIPSRPLNGSNSPPVGEPVGDFPDIEDLIL